MNALQQVGFTIGVVVILLLCLVLWAAARENERAISDAKREPAVPSAPVVSSVRVIPKDAA